MYSSFLRGVPKEFPVLAIRIAALLSLGIMAGFFFTFSNPVMPALQQLDAELFIPAFNSINIVVRNDLFFIAFFFPLAALAGAVLIDRENRMLWLTALAIYAFVIIQTRMVNVPINEYFKTLAGAPPPGWQNLRDRWAISNMLRTLLTTLSFLLALYATSTSVKKRGAA